MYNKLFRYKWKYFTVICLLNIYFYLFKTDNILFSINRIPLYFFKVLAINRLYWGRID